MKFFYNVLRFVTLLILLNVTGNARSYLSITDCDISAYPTVKAHYFAFDSSGRMTQGFNINDFSVTDNSSALQVVGMDCPQQAPYNNASVIVSFDLGINNSQFDLAKYLAEGIFEILRPDNSECALISFDTYSYLDQDFTNDRTKLSAALAKLQPQKGSLYDVAFLSQPSGAIPLSEKGKYNKSIILITDGLNYASADSIINAAKEMNVRIYAVSVKGIISEELKTISLQSGGMWFEEIDTRDKADVIVFALNSLVFNYKPCEITWKGELNCDEVHSVRIAAKNNEYVSNIYYKVPESYKPQLEANPIGLAYGSVLPGSDKTLSVTFTAKNSDITISGFHISPANNDFSIVSGDITNNPVVLAKGSSHTVTLKYTPSDSSLVFTRLIAESNACSGYTVLITGGFPNTPPKTRNLKIESPNGGEVLTTGDTAIVKWSGLLPADVIQLEYSIDNGAVWDTLDNDITGLEYKWHVPDRPSEQCLVRVIQLWPNNIGQTKDFRHGKSVNAANFNKEGNLIISASKDTTARIWNSNTGAELFKLKGHTEPLVWANFDLFDKYAVTTSEDNTARIWDIKTGNLIKELKAHREDVKCANFSPDGASVVTVSKDGYGFVWDVESGAIKDTIAAKGNELWFAVYTPQGQYIAFSDHKGIIKFWDVAQKKITRTFETKNGIVPYIGFNYDCTRMATASWSGKAIVWNVETGDTVFSVVHSDLLVPINSASFDYTGKILLTSGRDFVANMWNATNGAHIAQLKEHSSNVLTAVFNFDGSRVLTSSWDSTAKVWNLDKRDLQMDSSDYVFTIARTDITANDMYFGRVTLGDLVDSTFTPFITNNTKYKLSIKDIRITGDNAQDFSLVQEFLPYTIDSMSFSEIEIRFKPTDIGLRRAILEIDIPGRTIEKSLTGDGTSHGIQILTDFIDFGKVGIGDYKDTTVSIVLRNISSKTINMLSVSKSGPDDKHFDIISGDQATSLAPGAVLPMTIRFTPEFEGRRNGVVSFVHDGDGSPAKINLFGEGVNIPIDTLTIAMTSYEGKPGDIIEIPVRIKDFRGLDLNTSIGGIIGDLTFNATLLEPLDNLIGSVTNGDKRTITFTLPVTPGSDSVIGKLRFRVGLGNDTISDLRLRNVAPAGKSKIVLYEESAKFRLTGICQEGGIRLFESDGQILLEQNTPNPASSITTIRFETIEYGNVRIYVTNTAGVKVSTLIDYEMIPGKYAVDFNTSSLPQGVYFYVLETPTYTTTRKLAIER